MLIITTKIAQELSSVVSAFTGNSLFLPRFDNRNNNDIGKPD